MLAGIAPEAFWLLEHPPVITLGKRGGEVRSAGSTPVVRTRRGGLATWHGPGQLVGYLILDLASRGGAVRDLVCAVEQGIIDWGAARGLPLGRRSGAPGVWCGGEKLCAVGFHFRRGVSLHGFALNVSCDLRAFDQIVPCGIGDHGVTSLERLGGSPPPVSALASEVGTSVVRAIDQRIGAGVGRSGADLSADLSADLCVGSALDPRAVRD